MKNDQDINLHIQKIKAALAEERESLADLESLIGQRIEVELWGLGRKDLEKESWDSFYLLEKTRDCLEEEPIVSHRKAIGHLIVRSKKFFRSLMRPYTKMTLARQSRFNRELVRIQWAVLLRLQKIEERIANLEAQVPPPLPERSDRKPE